MAQAIQNAHFLLPAHIPYYGPGGIPFAYPPVALYVLAALAKIPGTSIFTWFRYVPVIMCALSLWPVYGLYRELLPSTLMARIATVLFAASPAWLAYDLWAAGSVRSFAFFWAMLALLFGWRAVATGTRGLMAGACLCFAVALASHLEAAIFLVISLAIFVATCCPCRISVLRAGLIMIGGTLIASPWWVTVLVRDGPGPFLASMHSHGGVTGQVAAHSIDPINVLAAIIAQYVVVDPLSLPIYAVALLGFARCLRERAWALPLWTLCLWILMPEGQRFVVLGLAGAASIPLAEIPLQIRRAVAGPTDERYLVALAVLSVTALFSSWHMCQWEFGVAPDLTPSTWHAAAWLRQHTPPDARFMVVSTLLDQPEWFPFLSHRTSVIGHWGAEWTGRYNQQASLVGDELHCAQHQSYTCLHSLLQRHHLSPHYLVLVNREILQRLQRQIASQREWHEVYINRTVVIWAVSGS